MLNRRTLQIPTLVSRGKGLPLGQDARQVVCLFAASTRCCADPLEPNAASTHNCNLYLSGNGLADDVVIFPTPQEKQSGSDLKDLLVQRLRRIATEEARSEVIVIGHYPTLSKAFAWLACQKAWPLPQDYGAAACLHCQDSFGEASGALKWLVTAELMLGIQRYPR